MRFGEHCLWIEVNKVLDAYKAGLVPRSDYLAVFDAWHDEKREANRRQVARTYGEQYAYPRENEE